MTATKVRRNVHVSNASKKRNNEPHHTIDKSMSFAMQSGNEIYESESSQGSKDEAEQTLEKLVFGDDEGFLQSLKSTSSTKEKHLAVRKGAEEDGTSGVDNEDLADLADEDVSCSHAKKTSKFADTIVPALLP